MLFKRVRFKFSLKQHAFMALLGSMIFCLNFVFFYRAAPFISSGLLSIIFSSSVIMIMINSKLFFKKDISLRMLLGALTGIMGLCLIFLPELKYFSLKNEACVGLLFGLLGSYCFAMGNQVSFYCGKLDIPLVASTFWGMVYGALLSLSICLIKGVPFVINPEFKYIFSVFYLAVPGSVVGFLTYLSLVRKIGPERAVYATLFFPIVALIISTIFESFHWVIEDYIGCAMVLLGNFLVMVKPERLKSMTPKRFRRSRAVS